MSEYSINENELVLISRSFPVHQSVSRYAEIGRLLAKIHAIVSCLKFRAFARK